MGRNCNLAYGGIASCRDFELFPERFVLGEYPLAYPRQEHDTTTKSALFVPSDVALLVPKRIEHTDQGGPLSREIMQIEQFKASHTKRA